MKTIKNILLIAYAIGGSCLLMYFAHKWMYKYLDTYYYSKALLGFHKMSLFPIEFVLPIIPSTFLAYFVFKKATEDQLLEARADKRFRGKLLKWADAYFIGTLLFIVILLFLTVVTGLLFGAIYHSYWFLFLVGPLAVTLLLYNLKKISMVIKTSITISYAIGIFATYYLNTYSFPKKVKEVAAIGYTLHTYTYKDDIKITLSRHDLDLLSNYTNNPKLKGKKLFGSSGGRNPESEDLNPTYFRYERKDTIFLRKDCPAEEVQSIIKCKADFKSK